MKEMMDGDASAMPDHFWNEFFYFWSPEHPDALLVLADVPVMAQATNGPKDLFLNVTPIFDLLLSVTVSNNSLKNKTISGFLGG